MSDGQSFQRFSAVTAIVSFFLIVVGGIALQPLYTNFGSEVFTEPDLMITVGVDGAKLLRWGMIVDMLGYYLLLLPVALFLWRWLESSNPNWIRFYTFCGLGYILIGAIGAAILAVVQPPLINAYTQASTEERENLALVFDTLWNVVYGGLWNILEVLLAGVWFLGIGLLMRGERRLFSIISIILGVSALLDSFGNILNLSALATTGLYIYLGLAPIWALWLGIDMLRKPVQIQTADNSEAQ